MKREILENISLEAVKPYKNNPRKNDKSVEYVVNSIKEFGYGNPIIVDEKMEIIAGHTRFKAIKKLKWKELPEVVKLSGLTEAQKKAYRIADNSSSSGSEWELDLLKLEIDGLSYDMTDFGLELLEGLEIDLPDLENGEKSPFQQMTFILSDEQINFIKESIDKYKKSEHYKYIETYGNENSNGNAIYGLVQDWLSK